MPTHEKLPESQKFEYRDEDGRLMAVLVKRPGAGSGISFFTNPGELLQVGLMRHPKGKHIDPHYHPPRAMPAPRIPTEVLYVIRGQMGVTVYSGNLLRHTFTASSGDTVIMHSGGHGFEFTEDAEVFEVRHGPHGGSLDKIWITENENGAISTT